MKRFLSILLSALLLISIVTIGASAEDFSLSRIYFDNSVAQWPTVHIYGWDYGLSNTYAMTNIAGTDIWYYDFPQALPNGAGCFLFKPYADSWDNQTSNIIVTAPYNCYKIKSTSNPNDYKWRTYTEGEENFILDRVYVDNSEAQWENVYIYGWGESGLNNTSAAMTNIEGTDIWYYDFPQGLKVDAECFLFKPYADNWNIQTPDIAVVAFRNCYILNPASKVEGTWTTYTEPEETTTETTEVPTPTATEPQVEETEITEAPTPTATEPQVEETEITEAPTPTATEPQVEETEVTEAPTPTATEPQVEETEVTEAPTPTATEAPETESKTLYFVPGSDWSQDDAKFAAYFYGAGETWSAMTDADGDGTYECEIPEGNWTNVIFVRINPASADTGWDGKWNQTVDLTLGEYNCFTITNPWDEASGWNALGEWSTYTVETPTESTEPVTETTQETLNPDVVAVTGDIELELTAGEGTEYTGTIDLAKGTYAFRINEYGAAMGFGYGFTDVINNAVYSHDWVNATEFTVSGGRYTFTYNTDTNTLTVKCKAYSTFAEIIGDINAELVTVEDGIFTGYAELAGGNYSFSVMANGEKKMFYTIQCGGTDVDFTWGIDLVNKAINLENATAGMYTFTYNANENTLLVSGSPISTADVTIFGDINLDLTNTAGGTLYTGKLKLEAGTYKFRVNALGTTMCFGYTFTNSIYKIKYTADWKADTTFNVTTAKTFLFRYDTSTNQLTIY